MKKKEEKIVAVYMCQEGHSYKPDEKPWYNFCEHRVAMPAYRRTRVKLECLTCGSKEPSYRKDGNLRIHIGPNRRTKERKCNGVVAVLADHGEFTVTCGLPLALVRVSQEELENNEGT